MHVSLSDVFNLLRLDMGEEASWITQMPRNHGWKGAFHRTSSLLIDVGRCGKTGKRVHFCSFCLLRVRMQFSMTLVPSYLAKYLEINKISNRTSLCLLTFKLTPRPQTATATEIRVLAAIKNKCWYGSQSPYPIVYKCLFYISSLGI